MLAMYKNRNTGTGNGMRRTRGMGGMLYFGDNHYATVNRWVIQTHYFKTLALNKTNYRPVSVLPPVSKIFKGLMQKQINEHTKNKLFLSSWGSNWGFCGWILLYWPLDYGDTASTAIRQDHKSNIKLMKCHSTYISLPWSNVTHFCP